MSQEANKELIAQAAEGLHRQLLDRDIFQSCYNCEWMNEATSQCTLFKAQPPVKIIMFSCGKNWAAKIPF